MTEEIADNAGLGIIAGREAIAQGIAERWHHQGRKSVRLQGEVESWPTVAGMVIDPGSPMEPGSMEMERFRRILQWAGDREVARVVVISSALTMVRPESGKWRFEEGWRPVVGDRRVGKPVERALWREGEVYRAIARGLDAVMLNPTVVVGDGFQGIDLDLLEEELASGRPVATLGGVEVAVVGAEDVVRAVMAALARGRRGRRYLVNAGEVALVEMVRRAAQTVGRQPPRREWSARWVRQGFGLLPDERVAASLRRFLGLEGQWRAMAMRGVGQGERCAGELMVEPLSVETIAGGGDMG